MNILTFETLVPPVSCTTATCQSLSVTSLLPVRLPPPTPSTSLLANAIVIESTQRSPAVVVSELLP
jgi:hypothetical protein